jgi:hypothetical protein
MARQTQQSLIQEVRSNLEERAAELRPLVRELQEVEAALRVLPKDGAVTRPARGRNVRRTSSVAKASSSRTRPSGRSERFLGIVKENPGITMARVAKKMGVQPSALYRIQHSLTKESKIKKSGTELTAT